MLKQCLIMAATINSSSTVTITISPVEATVFVYMYTERWEDATLMGTITASSNSLQVTVPLNAYIRLTSLGYINNSNSTGVTIISETMAAGYTYQVNAKTAVINCYMAPW